MINSATKLVSLAVVLIIGIVIVSFYRRTTEGDRKVIELEKNNQKLQEIVGRLTDEHRVAEMMVTDQKMVNGVPQTTLLFVESTHDRKGTLPPKIFTISGNEVHLDAKVIKFQHGFVVDNDLFRNHSIALFYKIYGNHQSPDDGLPMDAPDKIPGFYEGTDPQITSFETDLWTNFWKLTKDTAYRNAKGVRISDGEGLWWPCEKNEIYTITIETDGGLSRTVEPMPEMYREAIKRAAQ